MHPPRALLWLAITFAPAAVLAQTRAGADSLYWQRRFTDARRAYETALALNPDDRGLRLAYGQMLVETLQEKRARQVLTPLVGKSGGQAELLLGTNAYWSGDYASARRYFIAALRADSTLAKARLQLYEIAAVTAPSLRFGVHYARDDQPLRRIGVSGGGEYFVLPNVRLWVRGGPMKFASPEMASRDIFRSEGGQSLYLSRARVEFDYTMGLVSGAFERNGPAPILTQHPVRVGSLTLGKRFPRHLTARVSAERDRYLYTLASLDTLVMTNTGRALLALNGLRGWLGEASLQRQWFPDDNAVTSGYVWFLAPIARSRVVELKAGYAAGAQSADESRFALARPQQQVPPGDPRYDLSGRYSPYYTPDHLMTHSVLLAATTRLGSRLTLRTNASVGIHATDNAPMFERTNSAPPNQGPVRLTSYRRSFTPWSARAALDVARGNEWILALTGDYQHTSFYSAGTAGVQLTRRFTAAAIRRADRY